MLAGGLPHWNLDCCVHRQELQRLDRGEMKGRVDTFDTPTPDFLDAVEMRLNEGIGEWRREFRKGGELERFFGGVGGCVCVWLWFLLWYA